MSLCGGEPVGDGYVPEAIRDADRQDQEWKSGHMQWLENLGPLFKEVSR